MRLTCAIRTQRAHHLKTVLIDLPDAEVTQVDQRVGQRLERVVQIAQSIKAQQQATKLVFPSKYAFDGVEAFFQNGGIK